jgi:hypothetical protein
VHPARDDVQHAFVAGLSGGSAELAAFERRLAADPHDLAARAGAVGALAALRASDPSHHDRRASEHVAWCIEHVPEHPLHGLFRGPVGADFETHALLRSTWLDVLQREPEQASVLLHAAEFFEQQETARALELVGRALELAPDDADLLQRAAHMSWNAATRAQKRGVWTRVHPELAGEALAHAREAARRWERAAALPLSEPLQAHLRCHQAVAALACGAHAAARAHALAALHSSATLRDSWPYGNVIHEAHLVLGWLALEAGDVDGACVELLAAGRTPGSPQLNSFGPDLLLAKTLYERGARRRIVAYLEACALFWHSDHGRLDALRTAIGSGEVPSWSHFPTS